MIRLTLLLIAVLFAAFFIFGKDQSGANAIRLAADNKAAPVVAPPTTEEPTAPEDKIRPVNPNEATGVDRSIPPITEPRVISQDPAAPAAPTVVVTEPAQVAPTGEAALGSDGQVQADPPARNADGTVESAATDPGAETKWYVAADKVNLRAGKGTEFAVVGAAYFAEPITVLSSTTEEWVQIRLADGTEAYVKSEFLTPTEPQQ